MKNYCSGIIPKIFQIVVQDRTDFMQLLMNAHKEPTEEKQEDKEHDKEFKEMHKGVTKRGQILQNTQIQRYFGGSNSNIFNIFMEGNCAA